MKRDNSESPRSWKIFRTESSPNWGGQEERLVRESRLLTARGHRVTVICDPRSALAPRAREAGLRVVEIPFRSTGDPMAMARLIGLCQKERPDVIHTQSPKDSWSCVPLHLAGIPVVRSRNISLPETLPWNRRLIYRYGCRRVIATAEFIRRQLLRYFGWEEDRVVTIGEGVDLKEFHPGEEDGMELRRELGLAPDAVVFGIVAMLRGEKGHAYFVRAAMEVCREYPQARFLIVGKATSGSKVEDNLRRLLESEYGRGPAPIIMTGFRQDIPRVMRALDVLVVPSTHEAQTLVIPQAFATGKPAIGSEVGGIPELVVHEKTGLLVQPRDKEGLAAAMKRLIRDKALREQMGITALNFARQELSIEQKVDLLESVYAQARGMVGKCSDEDSP